MVNNDEVTRLRHRDIRYIAYADILLLIRKMYFVISTYQKKTKYIFYLVIITHNIHLVLS